MLAALVLDFGVFFAHYLFHRVPFLWEFHKVHHSAEVLTPITVYRMHPVDDLITAGIVGTLVGLLDGVFQVLSAEPIAALSIYQLNLLVFVFLALGYHLRHSHVWLDYGPFFDRIFISPAQHQLHHSRASRHFDKNLGFMFAFWDRVFGTLYIPKGREELRFGLDEAGSHEEYQSVWRLYRLPFIRSLGGLTRNQWAMAMTCAVLVVLAMTASRWAGVGYATPQSLTPQVYLEELTWMAVRDKIDAGYTTVIVPTGGTEQNGPHVVLGKHNYIVRHTAGKIARTLGHTLVAPVMAYVPEGDIDPPTEHMRFAGTLSLPEPVFEQVLEHTARSLKAHGFTTICLVGDSGGNQAAQQAVAERLNREWQGEGVRVVHVGDYYAQNGQVAWLIQNGETPEAIGGHAGIRDTSELMVAYPQGVLADQMRAGTGEDDFERYGVNGDPHRASPAYGKQMLDLKVRAAVQQIRREQL